MVAELWVCSNCRKRPPVNGASQVTYHDLELAEQEQSSEAAWQLALFKTKRRREWVQGAAFSKTC